MFPKENERGIFEDRNCLVQDLSRAYQNDHFTDLSIELLDGVTILTNRSMLASRSDYFAGMLYGGLKEGTSDKVVLKCCDSKIFRLILDYIFTGKVDYSKLSIEPLLNLMENARMMCLERLVGGIEDYLKDLLKCKEVDIKECLVMLEFCIGNKFGELVELVLESVDLDFENVRCHEDVCQLSVSAVKAILKYQERLSPEIDVFNALVDWIGKQSPVAPVASYSKEEMLSLVDLVSINCSDLVKVVRTTGYFDDKTICDAMEKQLDAENVNMCSEKNGAKIVDGTTICQRISVELNTDYVINKIEFLLWNFDQRSYSYILESSLDGIKWSTILDCRDLKCKGGQTIFFGAKRMKFISVKGTNNTARNNNFHIQIFIATLDTTTSERKNIGMERWEP
eukprot:GFUD01021950.1.p1 GENE.GFUD01021950.1~~GFUD01021950.1.p1  ORF type:complete len:396 (+),score=66.55 GFUD01021950.1:74-1261(+)